MSKETYIVDIEGIPTKIYAASETQAKMAKAYIEKTLKTKDIDLSEEAQQQRIKDAVKAHKIRRGESVE